MDDLALSCICFITLMYVSRLHSWGDSLEEAFEQCAMAMFGYMTDTETVEPIDTVEVDADLFFIPREVKVLHIDRMHLKIQVKAITYSAMQVHDIDKPEIFAIIDI
uniref:Protein archease n=1 Tax=Hucho hucho TaxID=62062 RepID=A0A4W5PU31_9TELE